MLRRLVCRTARSFSGGPSAEAIAAIQSNFKANPTAALTSFSCASELTNGLICKGKMRSFELRADEPEAFGGQNTAPNPLEILLFSLGSCQEITAKAFANAMGIEVSKVSVELEGHVDLRGFFAVDSSVRPGFSKIVGSFTVESKADLETIKKLKEVTDQHCPVKDALKGVPIEVTLNHVQK